MKSSNFTPALFSCLKEGYSFATFRSDIIAGLTVAIVALPLAMAMAVASGASPDKGLVTAVIAGFFISFLGGSRVQIGGPTGAFVVVIFDIIARFGFDGLIVASIMAGIILIIAGYAKLGKLIKYIPYPVITGFTTGIAVIIASTQVKDFLGLRYDNIPANFIEKWQSYFTHLDVMTVNAFLVGLATLIIIIACKKISAKIPSYLVAILAVSIFSFFVPLGIETIGSRFPNMPEGLPSPTFPDVSLEEIRLLIPSAFTIAFLAGIEALLSAVVADSMTGYKHSLNQELIGQGIANAASGIFGGLPATGAIARTATNIKSGGKTPISGIMHSVFLLVFLYTAMDILAFIPMSALAAVLFMVAYGMSDLKHFIAITKISPSDRTILLLTFFLTVLVDLTVAIGVGVTFASLLFMRHMSSALEVKKHNTKDQDVDDNLPQVELPEHVSVFHINGALFFGAASELQERVTLLNNIPKILILHLRNMPYIDASGEAVIEDIISACKTQKTYLILSGMRPQPLRILHRANIDRSKEIAFVQTFNEALDLSKKLLADEKFVKSHH